MARPKILKTTRSEREVLSAVLDAARVLGLDISRQNTGAATFPGRGGRPQVVRFGQRGASDLSGQIDRGPNAGKRFDVEVKEECFDPNKLGGEKREHFERQLSRLRKTNEQGGIAFWTRDAGDFLDAMRKILRGAKVDIDEAGFCWLVSPDEPKGGT